MYYKIMYCLNKWGKTSISKWKLILRLVVQQTEQNENVKSFKNVQYGQKLYRAPHRIVLDRAKTVLLHH